MDVWIQPRIAVARLAPATLARVDEWSRGHCAPPAATRPFESSSSPGWIWAQIGLILRQC